MTRQTDTSWITEGARVAEYAWRHHGNSATLDTIERLTKTQILLTNGKRYRRDTLRPVGEQRSSYGGWTELLPAGDPRVVDVLAAVRMRNLAKTITPKLERVNTLKQALDVLAQIETAVADTRTRVEVLRLSPTPPPRSDHR